MFNTAVIIDVVAAAILVGFAVCGGRRGLVRSAAGLAVVLAALVGAGIFANAAAPVAARYLQPAIEKRVEARVDRALEGVTPQEPQIGEEEEESETSETGTLLALLGIDADPAGSIAEKAREQVRDSGVSAVTAVVTSLAESVLHTVLFTIGFVVLVIVLKLLVGAMDLVMKLPGLHLANAVGGAAVGLIEGVLAVFLAVWVLRRFGVSFDTAPVAETRLLRFFAENTPLSILSFL